MLANRLAKREAAASRKASSNGITVSPGCSVLWRKANFGASSPSKGGTALKRCYFGDYRFSEDLDFTLLEPTPFEDLRLGLDPVYAGVREASGIEFAFDREDRHSHANSHTFYLRYIGPLPAGGSVK